MAHTGKKRNVYEVWCGNLKERDYLEYRGIGGRVIEKYIIKEIFCEGVDWIDLVEGTDKWWPLFNTVMKF